MFVPVDPLVAFAARAEHAGVRADSADAPRGAEAVAAAACAVVHAAARDPAALAKVATAASQAADDIAAGVIRYVKLDGVRILDSLRFEDLFALAGFGYNRLLITH